MSSKPSKPVAKPYHHGDLRRCLLESASIIAAQDGFNQVTMRRLATQAGVSRAALYHHFENKGELLATLAIEGFDRFEQVLAEAFKAPASSLQQRFEHWASAYIGFAADNPQLYTLMFGREIWTDPNLRNTLKQSSDRVMQGYVDFIHSLQQEGHLTDSLVPEHVAYTSWASLHGLCQLYSDGVYDQRTDLEMLSKQAAALFVQRASRNKP